MSILRLINPRVLARAVVCLLLWGAAFVGAAGVGPRAAVHFDVPAGDAAVTLPVFTRQSGEQILYAVEQVRGHHTAAVRGFFRPTEALEIVLAHSGLAAVRDDPSGAMVIKAVDMPRGPLPVRATEMPREEADASRGAYAGEARSEPVMLSPFEVQSRSDTGYRAANTVSATRIAIPTGQLPMNVTTFTEAFITDQKPYDLYDVVKWSSGVHQDNVSPQGWVRYNIRGFTSAAVQRNGFGSFRFIDTTDIERVEVVKGPASLLYGQINPGGVINYITKRPEAKPQLNITAEAGTNDYDRASVDVTGPVSSTRSDLLYRVIAMREDIPQFKERSRGKKYMVAPSFTWRLADRASLTVEYEHFARLDDMLTSGVILRYVNGIPTVPYGGLPWNFSYAGEGDFQNFISDVFTADFTAHAGEHVDLRATFCDSYWDMEWRATGQGGTGLVSQAAIDAYYPKSAGLTPDNAMFRRNRWEHQWGGERTGQVDIVGHYRLPGANLRLLAGDKENFNTRISAQQKNNVSAPGGPLYLAPWDLRDPATWRRGVPFGVDALAPVANTAASSNASSQYAVVFVTALDDRLCLLGGYARHRLHNDPTFDRLAGTSTAVSDRAANVPQAGVLYTVATGVSLFGSYSESFLANPTMLRINNVPATPAAPSVGRGWETGLKLDLLDGKLSGTISLYRVWASPTGIITVTSGIDPSGTTQFTDIQGGSQLSRGGEVDLIYAPVDGLQITTAFSRCDAEYKRNPVNAAFDGTPLVATPDETFSTWASYIVQHGPLSGVKLAGGFNYVGSMSIVANNPLARTAPYTTVDAMVGYRFSWLQRRWLAELSVKNIGDRHYYESNSTWGFPRHAEFSLSVKF